MKILYLYLAIVEAATGFIATRCASAKKDSASMKLNRNIMRHILITTFSFLTILSFGQDKYNYVHFNKLTELTGTEYVIASMENRSKIETKNKYLLFINTENGQTTQIDFPKDASIYEVEQIKIDSLEINKVLVIAKTVNLDGSKSIDWSDPSQIIILSTDGKEKKQLTEDKFFVRTWSINNKSGTIVVTGHYDTNNNGKYDKKDKNEILIYDLKTLNLKHKI
jgi:dipeptidyl aminopeptidase/acylaminoacyl peptidase